MTLPSIGDVIVAGMNTKQKSYFSTTLVQTAVLEECDRSIIYIWNELWVKWEDTKGTLWITVQKILDPPLE